MKINNYGPISLSSNLGETFVKILKNRIYKILDSQQPVEQAGFWKSYSTIDHIQTINQLLEKTNEFDINLAITFIYLNKAFVIIRPTTYVSTSTCTSFSEAFSIHSNKFIPLLFLFLNTKAGVKVWVAMRMRMR